MKKSSEARILAIILMVFISCGANVVFLEAIIRLTPAAGNVINLAQNIVISVEGFIITTRCGRKQSIIPLKNYIFLVINFFAVSFTTSLANVYKIPMPLIMIFRSGSLIANLILGILILKRRYSLLKYVSVLIITIGIIVCTFASVQSKNNSDSSETTSPHEWMIGISLMMFSLFASANMGISQEKLYQKFGKHPREALFYTHFLQLPGFLFLSSNIIEQIVIFNKSRLIPIELTLFSISIPQLWVLLFLNCVFQYICIRSVFALTTECTSLTVTLVVTLRKFLSLIFSIFYFQNPFTSSHWFGTALVFFGTLVFVDIPQRLSSKLKIS